jgi:transcriptional regulator with PAS, ATPase and Fis domain
VIPLKKLREITEKQMIIRALQMYGSIRKAAKYLEVDHSTLVKKMQRYGIAKSGE